MIPEPAYNKRTTDKFAPYRQHFIIIPQIDGGRVYLASINVDGKKRIIGRFDTADAAHQAYLQAKRQYHPNSARLG